MGIPMERRRGMGMGMEMRMRMATEMRFDGRCYSITLL
jgi:hypothetical protein